MKKVALVSLLVLLFSISNVFSQQNASFFSKADVFLGTYVSDGKINYKAIKNNPESLNELMQLAKTVSVSTAEAKTYQAFWINAYNLSVIKGIVDAYPTKSPLDTKGFFDKTTYTIAGQEITLNDIENKKLRAQFGDPRFHFVLVCGARGCPPIIPKAYTATNLENLLQQQTVKALNDPNFIRVTGSKVAFSEIFKWYKEDFVKDGNEIDFLNKYRTEQVPDDAKVTYYSYDWRLNSE